MNEEEFFRRRKRGVGVAGEGILGRESKSETTRKQKKGTVFPGNVNISVKEERL